MEKCAVISSGSSNFRVMVLPSLAGVTVTDREPAVIVIGSEICRGQERMASCTTIFPATGSNENVVDDPCEIRCTRPHPEGTDQKD